MRHKGCASLGLWAFALLGGAAAARAAPLQLLGELTIINRTDQLDPSNRLFNLPGGREFVLRVLGDPGGVDPLELLGETTLAPAFWPDPGLTFTGPIAVDFTSPGPGIVEEGPLRVDGLQLKLLLIGVGDGTSIAPADLGGETQFGLVSGRTGRGTLVGTGVFRVDAIVPEPSTGMALTVLMGGLAATKRCGRDITSRSVGSVREARFMWTSRLPKRKEGAACS